MRFVENGKTNPGHNIFCPICGGQVIYDEYTGYVCSQCGFVVDDTIVTEGVRPEKSTAQATLPLESRTVICKKELYRVLDYYTCGNSRKYKYHIDKLAKTFCQKGPIIAAKNLDRLIITLVGRKAASWISMKGVLMKSLIEMFKETDLLATILSCRPELKWEKSLKNVDDGFRKFIYEYVSISEKTPSLSIATVVPILFYYYNGVNNHFYNSALKTLKVIERATISALKVWGINAFTSVKPTLNTVDTVLVPANMKIVAKKDIPYLPEDIRLFSVAATSLGLPFLTKASISVKEKIEIDMYVGHPVKAFVNKFFRDPDKERIYGKAFIIGLYLLERSGWIEVESPDLKIRIKDDNLDHIAKLINDGEYPPPFQMNNIPAGWVISA